MNILFVGDIFGSAGRKIVQEHIGHVREAHGVELTIVNAENAAGGFGVTPQIADDIFNLGADVLTTGNHVWDKKELMDYLAVPADSEARARRILRPINMHAGVPGYGVYEGTTASGVPYAVVDLMGKVFMGGTDDPFRAIDEVLKTISAKVIVIDFHGEATSEKVAMGWHLDGRVTAVLGTHTHIPTADERVSARRHGLPDRRGHERPLRQRDRRADRAGAAPVPHRIAGQIRSRQRQPQDVRGAHRLRCANRPRHFDPAHHAGRMRAALVVSS